MILMREGHTQQGFGPICFGYLLYNAPPPPQGYGVMRHIGFMYFASACGQHGGSLWIQVGTIIHMNPERI